jgi:hypothetical protein
MAKRGRTVRRSKPAPRKKRSPLKRKTKPTPRRGQSRKVTRALRSAKRVFAAQGFGHDLPGWEPTGGWQGDELAEEVSYMTHEEKLDWLEWLAEQLDTTISELFEMMGSP